MFGSDKNAYTCPSSSIYGTADAEYENIEISYIPISYAHTLILDGRLK